MRSCREYRASRVACAPSKEETCLTSDAASLCSVKIASPFVPLKRLFPVTLLQSSGFEKPFAAIKFEEKAKSPPYDRNHAGDLLFTNATQ